LVFDQIHAPTEIKEWKSSETLYQATQATQLNDWIWKAAMILSQTLNQAATHI